MAGQVVFMPAPETSRSSPPAELPRTLGLWDTVSITAGVIIGSGIFLVARNIAQAVESPGLSLVVWLVSGVLSLCGALSYAELGALLPRAGGQYVYLQEAYGPLTAFLFGWANLLAIQSGSIAAVAVGFAIYLGDFLPLASWQVKAVAVLCVVLLTWINYRGVESGSRVQNIFTAAKVLGLAGLIVAGFVFKGGSLAHFTPLFATSKDPGGLLAALGVAMIAALWCFDGWNNPSFAAGEIKNPERNLALGLIIGTAGVTLLYLLVNLVYLYVLPIETVARSERVAAETASVLLGASGGKIISLVVLAATFGCVNGLILAGARVTYAMSREGHFFEAVGRVHPRFRTPHVSLLVQGAWSCLLILVGGYDQLFTYVIFAGWIFYLLTTLAVVILRKKWPRVERPFRVPAYPLVPLLFVAAALWFIVNTLRERPWESLIGSAIVMIGVPVYLLWKKLAPDRDQRGPLPGKAS